MKYRKALLFILIVLMIFPFTVEARWIIDNPKTGINNYIIIIISLSIISSLFILLRKKKYIKN